MPFLTARRIREMSQMSSIMIRVQPAVATCKDHPARKTVIFFPEYSHIGVFHPWEAQTAGNQFLKSDKVNEIWFCELGNLAIFKPGSEFSKPVIGWSTDFLEKA